MTTISLILSSLALIISTLALIRNKETRYFATHQGKRVEKFMAIIKRHIQLDDRFNANMRMRLTELERRKLPAEWETEVDRLVREIIKNLV